MTRRTVFSCLIVSMITLLGSAGSTFAQSKDETAVATAVENLRKLLIDPKEADLNAITSKALSYGHSNGLVEDQKVFTASLVSGKFNFETIDQTEQTITVTGDAAIVRHTFKATTHDTGKDPGTANLKVLQVWQKQSGKWVLIARQAVKIVS